MSKKDIQTENEVYFLGSKESRDKKPASKKRWRLIAAACIVVVIIAVLLILLLRKPDAGYYFEPEIEEAVHTAGVTSDTIKAIPGDTIKGYVEILEETVNDVPMFVYVPRHATLSLSVGMPDKSDSTIIFITQAADIRGDNYEIVGDFVLAGEKLSRGVAKTGFCAVIDGEVIIGVSDNTPLLQKAIESKGYFFRQYPLVDDGVPVENNPKNKSIRRALATRSGKVIMVESRSAESFHDFAQALVDIGVNDAIYLVGSNTAFGWYYDKDHIKTEYGTIQSEQLQNISYIVWRSE